jgi:hypothetical protein
LRPEGLDAEEANPDMERRFWTQSPSAMKRFSQMSWSDVADRNIRDKTDAIADIIRNISEQCAAAVEGLHLAQAAAAQEEEAREEDSDFEDKEFDEQETTVPGSAMLSPHDSQSVPPTPELSHRASTAMSMASTLTPDRYSLNREEIDIPTKIVEADDTTSAHEEESSYAEVGVKDVNRLRNSENIINRASARVSAFGSA